MSKWRTKGFTLIELSIVLVIVGLIIGGVLVGQELISQAATRAQLTQIQKYDTAVNDFRLKYGYLPGDIPDPYASQFGFAARGSAAGMGDGNGVIQGSCAFDPSACIITGEEGTFWVDLSTAKMVDGSFTTATPTVLPQTEITGSLINLYLPQAKIGQGNYVYVWSGGTFYTFDPYYAAIPYTSTGINYFGVSAITDLTQYNGWPNAASRNLTVAQAYNMDKKIDDGLPLSGHVLALYVGNYDSLWADGSDAMTYSPPTQTAASPGSCFDNGSVASATQHYSTEVSGGSGLNCALSFQMQGAAR